MDQTTRTDYMDGDVVRKMIEDSDFMQIDEITTTYSNDDGDNCAIVFESIETILLLKSYVAWVKELLFPVQ